MLLADEVAGKCLDRCRCSEKRMLLLSGRPTRLEEKLLLGVMLPVKNAAKLQEILLFEEMAPPEACSNQDAGNSTVKLPNVLAVKHATTGIRARGER